jgi:outer membrane protein
MRKVYLTFIVLMVARIATAQSTSFTLEQCIDYALKNAVSIQNAQLDEKSAVAKVRETTGLGMPQVSGTVAISHNQKLNRFFSTYSDESFFFPEPIPGANNGDVVSAQNFFQLKSSGNAGLTINQLIFNGSYFVGLQAAQALKELSVRNTNQTRVETVEAVSKAFYLALINRERITLFNSNIGRLDTLLQNTKALNQNGFAETIDVDRLRVALNNLTTERENFVALQSLSLELLKFQMNYPLENPLEINGTLESISPIVSLAEYSSSWDYTSRPDFQALEVNRKLQALNIKNYYAQSLPSIGAFANLGFSTQSPTIGGIFKTNTNIEDNGLVGPDKWYGYSLFGVQMNVPIFGGLQLRYKIQQEKITLQKVENSIKQFKSGVDLEIKNSATTYQSSIRSMNSQKENMELAASIARITKIKYEQGVGSNIEVLDAENTLKESQVNYYNALYDALVAKVNLDKAYGKLLPETK